MEVLESHEKIHHAAHPDHGHPATPLPAMTFAKRIAILISVLAALLAISEMGAKSAQNDAIIANIEAANLWSFFQAKTIRMTLMRTQAEALAVAPRDAITPEQSQAIEQQVQQWRATAARYDSEPETREGRKELAQRAKNWEEKRDRSLAAYHLFEYGAAALQLAIVLASAAVVTGAMPLAWLAGGLGLLGSGLSAIAWLAPTLLHL